MDLKTKTMTITQAKKDLLKIVDDMESTHDHITLIKNGVPTSILMNLEDYESLIETLEILANPKILKSLSKSAKDKQTKKLLNDEDVW